MQIGRVLFCVLITRQLFCGVSPEYLCSVLALRPAASCVAPYRSGFIFVSSSSEPGLTRSAAGQAQWEHKQLRGRWVWPPRPKHQSSLSVSGHSVPQTAGILFCTFCLGSGLAGIPGELQLPAIPEASENRHGPPSWHVLCKARLPPQALKPNCCHLFSEQLCSPMNDRQATAGLNQEVKSPWRSRQTPVQKLRIVFVSLFCPQMLQTSTYCACCRDWIFIYLFPRLSGTYSPVGSQGENKELSLTTSLRPNGHIILCPGSARTSHRRCCFIQTQRAIKFNEEK